jgi:hypothetical protein
MLTHILTNRAFVSIAVNLAVSIAASLVAPIGFASIAASFSPLLQ